MQRQSQQQQQSSQRQKFIHYWPAECLKRHHKPYQLQLPYPDAAYQIDKSEICIEQRQKQFLASQLVSPQPACWPHTAFPLDW